MSTDNSLDTAETAGIFKNLNPEQRAAVTVLNNSVVAAGAGSGKTTVLASRFAYLVLYRDIPAEKILTLTFTKKAAAEMYARIYKTLKIVAENGSGSMQQKAQTALTSFFKTRIQTLDSYSTSIVKLAAHRYGIKPDFETDNESCKESARSQALQFMLEHRNQSALQLFLRTARPEQLAQELFAHTVCTFSKLSNPPEFERSLKNQFTMLIRDWCELTQRIQAQFDAISLAFIQKPASSDTEKKIDQFIQTYYQKTAHFLPDAAELNQYVEAVLRAPQGSRYETATASIVQQKLENWLNSVLDGVKIRKTGKHDAIVMLKEAAIAAESIVPIAALLLQAGVSADIMPLLDEFQSRFLIWKRTTGTLTFDDVASLAVTILQNEPDIRRNEKQAFDAIMIDEFQDNNSVQRDMLFLLAEKHDRCVNAIPSSSDICPDKLFFVGDEKQSIYRFRGADVSVFRSLTETLSTMQPLQLRCNYRSHAALIHASNIMFSGRTASFIPDTHRQDTLKSIFLDADIKNFPEYEATCIPAIVPSTAPAAEHSVEQQTPHIHLCILDKAEPEAADTDENMENEPDIQNAADNGTAASNIVGEELSAVENEAVFTAQKIYELTCTKDAPYKAKDCAILLRSYSKQIFYEKALREAGIPYVTENIVSFFSDAPVNDILHLIRLLAYPADVLSYAAVLASPFAGLSPHGSAACIQRHTASGNPDGIQPKLKPVQSQQKTPQLPLFEPLQPPVPDCSSPVPFTQEVDNLLDEHDKAAYRAARALYGRLTTKLQTASITDIITHLWYDEGYRYETFWSRSTALYRELYDYLYELARQADENGFSLADFADQLYRLQQDGSRLDDMEIPLERPPAVRIMSIHKSKGLQFPVVFLCDTAAKTGNNMRPDYISRIPLESDQIESMVLKPPVPEQLLHIDKATCDYFTKKFRAIQQAKEHAELRRLFYVAQTRAEKEVYITASLDLSVGKKTEETMEQAIIRYTEEKLKNQTENDEKKGTDTLISFGHDTVLHNGTCIALILPVISDWLKLPSRPPLFTVEAIPLWNRTQSKTILHAMHTSKNAAYTKRSIQHRAAPYYLLCTEENLIRKQIVRLNRLAPSSFTQIHSNPAAAVMSQYQAAEDFTAVEAVLNRFKTLAEKTGLNEKPAFTPADFGTIAHAYIEASVSGKPFGMDPHIAAVLSPHQQQIITGAAQKMAHRFMQSPLGIAVVNAIRKESEYHFRSRIKTASGDPVFIDGTIDVLFFGSIPETDVPEQKTPSAPELCIIDFKSDSEIQPGQHIAQLACYRKAALDITGCKNCRCILYYLRTAQVVDISAQAAAFDISAAADTYL